VGVRGIRLKSYDAAGGAKEFAQLKRASEQAKLRVPIDGQFALSKASDAHRRVEHGHVLGRVVLSVRR
jgi:NADPH:quinone reductase